jgi:hypothetical protein
MLASRAVLETDCRGQLEALRWPPAAGRSHAQEETAPSKVTSRVPERPPVRRPDPSMPRLDRYPRSGSARARGRPRSSRSRPTSPQGRTWPSRLSSAAPLPWWSARSTGRSPRPCHAPALTTSGRRALSGTCLIRGIGLGVVHVAALTSARLIPPSSYPRLWQRSQQGSRREYLSSCAITPMGCIQS